MLHAVTQELIQYSSTSYILFSSPRDLRISGCFPTHQHTGRPRTWRTIQEGFDRPGLEMPYVPSYGHWLELTHMVTPDYKEAGKDNLAVFQEVEEMGFDEHTAISATHSC